MKKILCYVAIVLLVLVIFVPPLTRIFYKEKEVVNVPKDKYSILKCTKDSYEIASSYKNSEGLNLRFKRLLTDANLESYSEEYAFESNLDVAIKELTNANIDQNNEEIITYYLEYKNVVADKLNALNDYRLPLEEQQKTYESKGYVCTLTE